jgi:hypothetical protein
MNVEIGTKATQFLAKEYINGIFIAVRREKHNSSGGKHNTVIIAGKHNSYCKAGKHNSYCGENTIL